MSLFLIVRRSTWDSEEDVEDAGAVLNRVAEEDMDDRVKWIRSYVVCEEDGTLGMVCVYEAEDEEAVYEHAQRAGLPADEVLAIEDTVIVRDDP
jgi:Nickel responsive protein SCO4226-like